VQPNLANRQAWQQKEAGYKRQIEAKGAQEAKADSVLAQFNALMNQEPEQVYEWIVNFQQNRPLLEAKAEAAALKAQLTERSTEDQHAQEEERLSGIREQVRTGLDRELSNLLQTQYAGLDLDKDELAQILWDVGPNILGEAVEGDETGLPPGTLYFKLDAMARYIAPAANAARKALEKSKAATQAAKSVAAASGNKKPAPPTVSAKGSPTPGEEGPPKTREEFRKRMEDRYGYSR
jgi:hypothetical protein